MGFSSLSATQFTVEKSDLISSDSHCFCGTTSSFAQHFTPEKAILENLTGELDVTNIKYSSK